jgi:hypothetical protein
MALTAADLINSALLQLGVLSSGQSAATQETADCLLALNELLASWSAQALPIYQITRESLTLSGAASYTIGTGQTWNTARPVKIKAASVVASNIRVPVKVVDAEEWAAVIDTGGTGTFAQVLFYDDGYPTGTVYLLPKPAGGALELYSYKPLAAFATSAASVDLPPGYERAIIFSLALEVSGQFGRTPSEALMALANDAKTSIFGLNQANVGAPQPQPSQPAQAA